MKKALVYTFTAILLGSIIILSPLTIFFSFHGEEGPIILSFGEENLIRLETRSAPSLGDLDYSLDARSQPTDPFIWTLAISFFTALIFYLLVKQKIPAPQHRFFKPV